MFQLVKILVIRQLRLQGFVGLNLAYDAAGQLGLVAQPIAAMGLSD